MLDDFMAADATFSDTRALQEAIAKDVEQRIATAHLRPMPSNAAPSRSHSLRPIPGETSHKSAYQHGALLIVHRKTCLTA